MYYNRWNFPTYPYTNGSYRSRRSQISKKHAVAALAARNRKGVVQQDAVAPASVPPQQVTYDDLHPVAKLFLYPLAGTMQVAGYTFLEYLSGFFSGFFLGTVVGTPGLFFRPLEPGVPKLFMTEVKGRFSRMNTRSMSWGRNWAGISAVFGGSRMAIKVIRNGKEDAWNQIFCYAAASAYYARADGPQAMLKSALVWGGLMYFFTGNQGVEQYTEKPLDF